MVSAVKMGGRRLYELAREGVDVERAERPVEIFSIDVIDFAPSEYPEAVIRVRCGTGTYVRTLADDIARALGGRAHLGALRRLAIGSLGVGEAASLDDLRRSAPGSLLLPAVMFNQDRLTVDGMTPEMISAAAGRPVELIGRMEELP